MSLESNIHQGHKNRCLDIDWKDKEYIVYDDDKPIYTVYGKIELWYCDDCKRNFVFDHILKKKFNVEI